MNHLIFALTAPECGKTFARINNAHANFEAWAAELRDKKIDVQHEVAVFKRLQKTERLLARYESIQAETDGAVEIGSDLFMQIRCERIYFRVLMLNLMNQEDAWQAAEDAKQAAKAAKKDAV